MLDAALTDLAGGDGAPPGFDPRRFLAPGLPRVRPLLVLLSARATRRAGAADDDPAASRRATEHVAAAAELLDIAIALHDAALGRPGGRRRRAARRLLGGAVGMLGGHHLTLRALELTRAGAAPETVGDLLEAMREIADTHARRQEHTSRMPTPEQVLSLADGHSGAVFAFACRAGGRISGADRPTLTALARYGRHTGIAWHVADDLARLGLDLPDAEARVELRAEDPRPSYTVATAAARDPAVAPLWERLQQAGGAGRALALTHRLHDTGAPQAAREVLLRECWAARKALAPLPDSPEKQALDRLAAGLARPGVAPAGQEPSGQS